VSDSDSFIEEVNEEVRRDQLYGYVRKYGWIGVLAVVSIVGFTGYLEWQKARTEMQAEALGDSVVSALEVDAPADRAAGLEKLLSTAGSAAVVIELRRAGELQEAGQKDAALQVLDRVAASDADPVYTDMAKLKAVMLRGSDMDSAARDAALAALAAPGQPYRPLALEQQAIAALDGANTAHAIEIYTALFQDSQATDSLRNRATQMLVAMGAEVPSRPQLLSQ
jgi:hypothetical protein